MLDKIVNFLARCLQILKLCVCKDNGKLLWGSLLQGSSGHMTGEVTSADTYWPIH